MVCVPLACLRAYVCVRVWYGVSGVCGVCAVRACGVGALAHGVYELLTKGEY